MIKPIMLSYMLHYNKHQTTVHTTQQLSNGTVKSSDSVIPWEFQQRCALTSNNNHLVTDSLYDKSHDWWLSEMCAIKARAYVNTADVILFSYGCIQQSWIMDKIYMVIYGMSFPVRMSH